MSSCCARKHEMIAICPKCPLTLSFFLTGSSTLGTSIEIALKLKLSSLLVKINKPKRTCADAKFYDIGFVNINL